MEGDRKPKGGKQGLGKGVKQGPKAVSTKEKQANAVKLRIAGFTYEDIAEELGYRNKGSAFKAVEAALRDTLREASDDLRNIELSRLDAMIAALYPNALRGSLGNVDRIVRMMERKSRLLGLDMPIEHRHSGTGETGALEINLKRVITADPAVAKATEVNGDNGD